MKRISTAIILLLSCFYLHAQTISGKVYREGTDSVIASATVYYGGSMSGTITDRQGRFTLTARQQQIPVIVSCIGYYSASVNYEPGKQLIIYLKPKLESLHEVTIRVNGMGRKEEIEIFTREFLGTSTYALSCTIKNMDDINLFYSKKTGVLTASADKPIIIENKKLGYTITYYLDNFARTYKNVQYGGNYIFKENPAPTPEAALKINNNREDAYIGSRMQFIRALWHETTDKTGFRIYTSKLISLSERDIVRHDSLLQKYISLENKIYIYHSSEPRHSSALFSKERYSFIDKDGYYGEGLQWAGPMANQRIGDLLPFEYQSASDNRKNLVKALKDTVTKKIVTTAGSVSRSKEDNKNIKLFKSLVLVNDEPVADGLVIRKWGQPICYKIFGTCRDKAYDQAIATNVSKLFGLITESTGLQINEAGEGGKTNFYILMGKPDKFKDILSPDARAYFNAGNARGATQKSSGYYYWSSNSFTDMIQVIDVDAIGQNKVIWNQIKMQLMNGLGFFGTTAKDGEGLFYSGVNNWVPEKGISPYDQQIIKTLYQPALRSGMTEQELDAALANKQL